MVIDPGPELPSGVWQELGDRRSCGRFWWRQSDSHRVIHVEDEVDLSNSSVLIEGADSLEGRELSIDLRAVSFMDSSGVGALVRLSELISPRRLRLTVHEGSPVYRLLIVTGLCDHFDVSLGP